MTDLTLLHAPSTLYLPEAKNETGLRFASNRWSLPPSRPVISTTPMVTVEMVDSGSPHPSPVVIQDHNLLSPSRRSSKSKDFRVPRTRPASAPPERPSKVRTIGPRGRLSPRPKSPDPASGRCSSIPIVVRPPTTLFRPTPFWRNTTRSAVNGTFYASSHHLIRRSTFIAAGLRFDKPVADLSALGVESRIGFVVLLPDSIP
ncbi:hypothetical protein BGY98DRAFT_1099159 [Russula aff. rugulosa BPL654]|nr:hypothetical protein BGY98DRAFT_1099159 [Russula aff. rugulosa BPL654]